MWVADVGQVVRYRWMFNAGSCRWSRLVKSMSRFLRYIGLTRGYIDLVASLYSELYVS